MYLTSHVPPYEEVRTFALERIETLAVSDENERYMPRLTFEMSRMGRICCDAVGAYASSSDFEGLVS